MAKQINKKIETKEYKLSGALVCSSIFEIDTEENGVINLSEILESFSDEDIEIVIKNKIELDL